MEIVMSRILELVADCQQQRYIGGNYFTLNILITAHASSFETT